MDMPEIGRRRALAYLAVVLGALAVGGHLLLERAPRAGGQPVADPVAAAMTDVVETRPEPKLVIHVVGAVRRPGLYRLPDGSRVDDAIRMAGGPTRKANLELVNLAAPVADGEQVIVPRTGGPPVSAADGAVDAEAPAGPVHLNTATLEQLDALPGVGPVTAQKILDYRAEHGAFRSVDELDAIAGIGPARLDQLRDLVVP
jgi:competence protein ComEA